MGTSTKVFDYVVNVPEGTDLSREPNRNPKTMDGRENIILRASFGTRLALEEGTYDIDGRDWIIVRPEIGNEEVIGWMPLDHLAGQIKFEVSAREGTDLRREPALKSKTEDGSDNVVFSLPLRTGLILLHNYDDAVTNDGHVWRLVVLQTGNREMGWVANDDLERQGPDVRGGITEGTTYTFKYGGVKRSITETNLKTALEKNKLSAQQLTDLQIAIELDIPYQNIKKYYTSLVHLQNMTTTPKIL